MEKALQLHTMLSPFPKKCNKQLKYHPAAGCKFLLKSPITRINCKPTEVEKSVTPVPPTSTPEEKEEEQEQEQKFVKLISNFNKEYAYIEKFNKIIKSFDVYPLLWKVVTGCLYLVGGCLEKRKPYYGKLKTVAAKYSVYLGAVVILLLAVAAAMWIKKIKNMHGTSDKKG